MKERRGSAEGVYRLGIRFEPDEKAKLEKMAKKVGCESIPMFVEYLIKAHEELEPDAERLKRELSFADIRIKVLESEATKVAAAHEEVLAQFRQVITEMGTAKDRAVEKQYEIGATRLQHTLTAFMGALGIEELDAYDEGVSAIKELKASGEDLGKVADALGVDADLERICQVIGVLCGREAERDELARMYSELKKKHVALEEKYDTLDIALKTVKAWQSEPIWVRLWYWLRRRAK